MAKYLTDPANQGYDAGLEFNYAAWTANTELLLTNVTWNNDYRDAMVFPGETTAERKTALDNYLETRPVGERVTLQTNYHRTNEPIRIDLPYNTVVNFNYVRARNGIQPIPGNDVQKDYYYFILSVLNVAPNNTQLIVELDVWATYSDEIELLNCYIERSHLGIANENNFRGYGREFLTSPEGLDTGAEYQVFAKRRIELMRPATGLTPDKRETYGVLVASTVELGGYDMGNASAPNQQSAKGILFESLPSGAAYYYWEKGLDFQLFMQAYADKPWITQGIISITAIPDIKRYHPDHPQTGVAGAPLYGGYKINTLTPVKPVHNVFDNWRESDEIKNAIPEKYRHLKKFFTFPYMAIEITTWGGTPVILKPESWNDANAAIMEMASLVPPQQRVAFSPRFYNSPDGGVVDEKGDDLGDFMDIATMIANFPTFALVNNGAISYMASNAAAIAFQQESADWSQTKALRGADAAYNIGISASGTADQQTAASIATDQAMTQQGNQYSQQAAFFNAGSSVGQGAISGAPAGPQAAGVGAVLGAVSGAGSIAGNGLSLANNDAMQGIRTQSAKQQRDLARNMESLVTGTNRSMAQFASKGDYAMSIAAQNAKIQDSKLIPNTTSGQVGGEAMNLINNIVELSVRWKHPDLASIKRIGDYWLRYGYAVNQFARIEKLMVMTNFTYWKLSETYIRGNIPEGIKQAIRGMFEKGVTLHSNPDNIGNIDIGDNAPIAGITL